LTTLLAGNVVRCRRHVPRLAGDGDAAGAIGVPFELPGDVLAAASPLALAVPTTKPAPSAVAPFGPAVSTSAAASDLDLI
jgi:hypothetical protein